jgi:NTP pyrophosphatase (non-canonical NTP hydrolase)
VAVRSWTNSRGAVLVTPVDSRARVPEDGAMIELPERAAMQDYQKYIHDLEAMHGWLKLDLVHNCFLMGEEVGELFKAVRKYNKLYDEGPSTPTEQARAHVAEEIVDVFNYLLAIANRVGVDLEQAFREKNARNQQRTWT